MNNAVKFLLSSFAAILIMAAVSEAKEAHSAVIAPPTAAVAAAVATSTTVVSSNIVREKKKDEITGVIIAKMCALNTKGSGAFCLRASPTKIDAWFNFSGPVMFQFDPYSAYSQTLEIRIEYADGTVKTGQYVATPSRDYTAAFLQSGDIDNFCLAIEKAKRVIVRIAMADGQNKVMTFVSAKGNFFKEGK